MKFLLLFIFMSQVTWAKEVMYGKASSFRGPTAKEKIFSLNTQSKFHPHFEKTINLLVWNIYLCQKKGWANTYRELIKDKNLVLTQEFYLTDLARSEFIKDKERNYVFSTAYILKKDNIFSGVATASNVASFGYKNLYSKFKEPILAVHKSSLFTFYKLKNGKKLLVVNVHAVNFVFDHIFGEQILTIEKEIKKHTGPVILAGDFNTFSYGKIKYLNLVAKNLSLKEIDYGSKDERKSFMKYPLDHVFYRDLKFREASVVESSQGSDHNAIVASFDII